MKQVQDPSFDLLKRREGPFFRPGKPTQRRKIDSNSLLSGWGSGYTHSDRGKTYAKKDLQAPAQPTRASSRLQKRRLAEEDVEELDSKRAKVQKERTFSRPVRNPSTLPSVCTQRTPNMCLLLKFIIGSIF